MIAHAHRGGVDDDVEGQLLQIGALDDSGSSLMRQLLGGGGAAIQDVDFDSAFLEAKDGGAGSSSGSDHQNARAFQSIQTAFQRPDDPGGVRIKAIELAVLRPNHSVAGSDFGGVGVGVVEVRKDRSPCRAW